MKSFAHGILTVSVADRADHSSGGMRNPPPFDVHEKPLQPRSHGRGGISNLESRMRDRLVTFERYSREITCILQATLPSAGDFITANFRARLPRLERGLERGPWRQLDASPRLIKLSAQATAIEFRRRWSGQDPALFPKPRPGKPVLAMTRRALLRLPWSDKSRLPERIKGSRKVVRPGFRGYGSAFPGCSNPVGGFTVTIIAVDEGGLRLACRATPVLLPDVRLCS